MPLRLRPILASVLPAAGLLISTAAQAQPVECDACLNLIPHVELSTAGGPIVPSVRQYVLRTADGRLLVSHLFANPQVVMYDSAGRFLELYDKPGRGPGQFRMSPYLFPGPSNTVWAFDQERLVKLDAQLTHIATRNLGQPRVASRAVVLANGSVVIDQRENAPGGGAFTVSIMDTSLNVTARVEREIDASGSTIIARALPEGFWTLRSNQLYLRRYSSTGQLLRTVPVVADHFQPWQGPAAGEGREGYEIRPRPRHQMLLDMGSDLIVLLTWTPRADWTPTSSNRMIRPGEVRYGASYDTIIALVDLRTGATVATTRYPDALQTVQGATNLVFRTQQDNDGHVITQILRLQARRP